MYDSNYSERFRVKFSQLLFVFIILISGCSTEPTPTYLLSLNTFPEEGGSVSPSNAEFDEGSEVKITATPHEHWDFVGWDGLNESQNPVTISMDSDRSIAAVFEKKVFCYIIQIKLVMVGKDHE